MGYRYMQIYSGPTNLYHKYPFALFLSLHSFAYSVILCIQFIAPPVHTIPPWDPSMFMERVNQAEVYRPVGEDLFPASEKVRSLQNVQNFNYRCTRITSVASFSGISYYIYVI